MRNVRTVLVVALLAGGALAQVEESASRPVFQARRRTSPVVVDGHLREWLSYPFIELKHESQVIVRAGQPESMAWQGPEEDLSARIYAAWTPTDLFFAGRVVDQVVVPPPEGGAFWEGDAVEIFLNAGRVDSSPASAGEHLAPGPEDYQVFLLPRNPARPWGVATFEKRPGGGPPSVKLADRGWTGVEVAFQILRDGYTFEMRLPLHNLRGLEPGAGEIGFNVAVGDHDPPEKKYTYMVWTGEAEPYLDARKRGVLRFEAGVILMAAPPAGPGLMDLGAALFQTLLLPFFLLVALALAYQVDARILRRRPKMRLCVFLASLLLAAGGLLLPRVFTGWRQTRLEASLVGRLERLHAMVRAMSEGALGSYRGTHRDGPLLDLLAGKPIKVMPAYRHEPIDLGPEPAIYPGAHLVRPYGIALPDTREAAVRGREGEKDALQLEFREPLKGGVGLLTFSYSPPRGTFFFAPTPRAQVRLIGSPGSEESRGTARGYDFLRPIREQELYGELGEPGRLAAYISVPLPQEGIRALEVSVQGAEEARLEGVTHSAPDDPGPGRPLSLGGNTLSGIPTNLFGHAAPRAGALIAPGTERTWTLPSMPHGRGWDRAWLILSARDRGKAFLGLAPGEKVATVRFRDRTGALFEWNLEHQEHLFSEVAEENERLEQLRSGATAAQVAFHWSGAAASEERRISVVVTTQLPGAPDLSSFTVVNQAPYAIQAWDLVLGVRKAFAPAEPEGSFLRLSPEGESVVAREEVRTLADGLTFAILRDEEPRARAARREGGIQVCSSRTSDDALLLRAVMALEGEGWGEAALEATLRDGELAFFRKAALFLGLLAALVALPFLFVFAVEALIALRTLRAKLVGSLALAAAVPLVLLSIFLVRVLAGEHEEREQERLMEELRGVVGQLEKETGRLEGECSDRLATLLHSVATVLTGEERAHLLDREHLRELLARELARMRPGEWSPEAFLRLDLGTLPGPGGLDRALVVFDREESRFLGEVASPIARAAFQLRRGLPFLSVRTSEEFPVGGGLGSVSLTLGVPVDRRLLAGIVGRSSVVLYDTEGYPLAWTPGTGPEALVEVELAQERDGARMREKRQVLERLLEGQQVSRNLLGEGKVGAFEPILDATGRGRPLLLLGVLDRSREPFLSLADLGSVRVGRFFGSTGMAILVLVLFVGWVVTDRVSRPLERLREGTGRLSRGELEVRVPVAGEDEIAELTEAFNLMAGQLQTRVRDAERLNQALRDFTSRLDLADVCVAVSDFLAEVVRPARALVVVADRAEEPLVVDSRGGGAVRVSSSEEPILSRFLAMEQGSTLAAPFENRALVESGEQALVVPLRPGGRRLGALVLLWRGERPALTPHFLDSLAGQIGVALENARLFHLAIEDPLTGAYVATYFRERLAQEVDRARRSGRPLALVRLSLDNLEEVAASRGPVVAGLVASGAGQRIRAFLGERPYLLGWLGRSDYELLFPEAPRGQIVDLAQALRADLEARSLDAGDGEPLSLRVSVGVVSCPEDAESAEFLADEAERVLVKARRGRSPREGAAGQGSSLLRISTPVISLGGQEIVVKSAKMQELFRILERVVATDLTVLLQGETGVGKEVFTDLIHQLSDRAGSPLVKINCSAFPETLLESELFGHEKGAFTGATGRKRGRFELAGGGTLFLDEVGEMSQALQVKLLRFLQDRCIERLGGSAPITVDVRIIAATNRDLLQAIQEGQFREDLYFRLKVVSLVIPPLRERKEDIPFLVEIFRKKFVEESGKHIAGLSADAMDRLYRHEWPGNIRELRNVLTRALYLAGGEVVEEDDLTLSVGVPGRRSRAPVPKTFPVEVPGVAAGELPARLERLFHLLQVHGSLSAREVARMTGSPLRTCSRNLTELVELGLAFSRGQRKGKVYRLGRDHPLT